MCIRDRWEDAQKKNDVINGPMSIYELHAGSWKMKEDGVPYNYSCLLYTSALNDAHSTLTFTGIHQPLYNVAV